MTANMDVLAPGVMGMTQPCGVLQQQAFIMPGRISLASSSTRGTASRVGADLEKAKGNKKDNKTDTKKDMDNKKDNKNNKKDCEPDAVKDKQIVKPRSVIAVDLAGGPGDEARMNLVASLIYQDVQRARGLIMKLHACKHASSISASLGEGAGALEKIYHEVQAEIRKTPLDVEKLQTILEQSQKTVKDMDGDFIAGTSLAKAAGPATKKKGGKKAKQAGSDSDSG
jgi:hypothetical protein